MTRTPRLLGRREAGFANSTQFGVTFAPTSGIRFYDKAARELDSEAVTDTISFPS